MALRVVTPFINTVTPGAYANVTVQSLPVGLGASGVIVLVGEADGGDSYQNVPIASSAYTVDQLAKVQSVFTSGQIVDAFRALSAPSADADIVGSANLVYIVKTNQGTKASAILPSAFGSLNAKNWGVSGNKCKFQVSTLQSEIAPTAIGATIATFGAALNGLSFAIRLNGGSAQTILLSPNSFDHANIADLVLELNSMLPAGVVASAGIAPNNLVLTMGVDALANRNGFGKSMELIDIMAGDLAAIGLSAGLNISSTEPAIEIAISRSDTGLNETIDVQSDVALQIGYAGSSASLTISDGMLTTVVSGGSGSNLNVDITQFITIGELATFLQTQPGYIASAMASAQQLPTSSLDKVSGIGIASSSSSLMPGRIKKSLANFVKAIATSSAVDFIPTASAGLPDAMPLAILLSGGTRGSTSSADIVNSMNQVAGIQCNIIVPLFSQDASGDIALGLTDLSSTYSIAAINAAVKSHCLQYSTPKLKRNRSCILSKLDTYQNVKSEAQSLANYRCALTMQSVSQVNSAGNVQVFQPWYTACLAAGMQAGGFYKAIVNKAANVISYIDPAGFDSGSPGSVEDALNAGLLFLSKDNARAGYWVSDQTTYGFDTNFVYNSIQAVYCSDLIALDMAQSFQVTFVGKSLADVDASVALAFLAQKMNGYKALKLIASSTDAPLGYKNAGVKISGPEMDVNVEIKLATAIYFIPININISQVQSSA
jgi:hypothetical protein